MSKKAAKISQLRPYELEAVEGHPGRLDVKVTNTQSGEETVLPALGFEESYIFEAALREVLGSREAVTDLYRNNARPRVTESAYRRILAAHADAGCGCC